MKYKFEDNQIKTPSGKGMTPEQIVATLNESVEIMDEVTAELSWMPGAVESYKKLRGYLHGVC